MILIAESGSTKTDWLISSDREPDQSGFSTMGFNPFFQTEEDVVRELDEHPHILKIKSQLTAVYFFGSGCSSIERCNIIKRGLSHVFPHSKITVGHDMLSAAYATCGDEKGIVGIIGTGSNSCYFDGTETIEVLPALGYILGDEGSGTYFGKQILKDFCYKKLPQVIQNQLVNEKKLDKDVVLDAIYRHGHANVYIASYASLMMQNIEHDYVIQLLRKGFQEFINVHILCFENSREVPVHFVGSIAWHYQEQLKQALSEFSLTVGKIIHKPSDALQQYLQTKV